MVDPAGIQVQKWKQHVLGHQLNVSTKRQWRQIKCAMWLRPAIQQEHAHVCLPAASESITTFYCAQLHTLQQYQSWPIRAAATSYMYNHTYLIAMPIRYACGGLFYLLAQFVQT